LKQLAAKAAADAQRLATAQAALFKVELADTGKKVGVGGALGVATLVIALFGTLFVLLTLAFVLVALGLPLWAGFCIVAVLLLAAAAVTALLAKRNIEQAKGPELALAELERTKAALGGSAPSPSSPGSPSSPTSPAVDRAGGSAAVDTTGGSAAVDTTGA